MIYYAPETMDILITCEGKEYLVPSNHYSFSGSPIFKNALLYGIAYFAYVNKEHKKDLELLIGKSLSITLIEWDVKIENVEISYIEELQDELILTFFEKK